MVQSVGEMGSVRDAVLRGGSSRTQLLRGARWAAGGFLVGLVLCVAYIVAQTNRFEAEHADRILPGTLISGVEVGGMTPDQATQTISGAVDAQLDRPIRLVHTERTWNTTPRQLGSTSDVATAVTEAMAASEQVGWSGLFRIRWLGDGLGFRRGVAVTHDEAAVRSLVDRLAGELNRPVRDASLSIVGGTPQYVKEQPGRAVSAEATSADLLNALSDGRDVVAIQAQELQPRVTTASLPSKVLVLRQSQHRLFLYSNGQVASSWLVAVGTGGYPTPTGRFSVGGKRYMPTWVNPDPEGWGKDMPDRIEPGEDNPLGVRALNWAGTGAIRFHGTSNIGSLGTNASHGCVRLSNHDIVQLYDLVPTGTPIFSLR